MAGATNKPASRRMRREERTVALMIELYCLDHHGGCLCGDCLALAEYARRQLARCRFGAQKPVCSRCTVHCYRAERREEIRAVMRYSGPRMLKRHPWLAIAHLLDRRRTPETAEGEGSRGDVTRAGRGSSAER